VGAFDDEPVGVLDVGDVVGTTACCANGFLLAKWSKEKSCDRDARGVTSEFGSRVLVVGGTPVAEVVGMPDVGVGVVDPGRVLVLVVVDAGAADLWPPR
jgi:hypothetical protein